MNRPYRQGDILFIPVDKIPEGSKPKGDGVIALGEATGHKHQLSQGSKAALEMVAQVMYINALLEGAEVVHNEHPPISLPPGNFQVEQQEEYHPESWRQVQD